MYSRACVCVCVSTSWLTVRDISHLENSSIYRQHHCAPAILASPGPTALSNRSSNNQAVQECHSETNHTWSSVTDTDEVLSLFSQSIYWLNLCHIQIHNKPEECSGSVTLFACMKKGKYVISSERSQICNNCFHYLSNQKQFYWIADYLVFKMVKNIEKSQLSRSQLLKVKGDIYQNSVRWSTTQRDSVYSTTVWLKQQII